MLQLNWDYALVDYLPDHELRRHSLNGLGVDLIFELTRKLTFSAGYGYGVDAPVMAVTEGTRSIFLSNGSSEQSAKHGLFFKGRTIGITGLNRPFGESRRQ